MYVLVIWDGKQGLDQKRINAAMEDMGYSEEKPFAMHLIHYALRDLERKGLIRVFPDPAKRSESKAVTS